MAIVKDVRVNEFFFDLRKKEQSPKDFALTTTDFLFKIVNFSKALTVADQIAEIKSISSSVVLIKRNEFVIGNIFLRGLDIIRACVVNSEKTEKGLRVLLNAPKNNYDLYNVPMKDSKYEIIQELVDLAEEIKSSPKSVSSQAVEHIHSREIILTFGFSEVVFEFLKHAARFRKFEVYVAESAPIFDGRKMACELGRVGIETTLIPDSSIFAMMARTNKVIIQTETAFASGTILARSGVKNLAMSAKHHSVTVVVLLELFKLSPKNIQEFNFPRELSDPKDIFPHSNPLVERIIVENPKYDLISSEYVDLFVTSLGGFTASGLYRILDELYNKEDIK